MGGKVFSEAPALLALDGVMPCIASKALRKASVESYSGQIGKYSAEVVLGASRDASYLFEVDFFAKMRINIFHCLIHLLQGIHEHHLHHIQHTKSGKNPPVFSGATFDWYSNFPVIRTMRDSLSR